MRLIFLPLLSCGPKQILGHWYSSYQKSIEESRSDSVEHELTFYSAVQPYPSFFE